VSGPLAQQLFKGSGTALIIRDTAAVLFGILVVLWPGVCVFALVILFGIYAVLAYRTHWDSGMRSTTTMVRGLRRRLLPLLDADLPDAA
jgi:hypothetical protein